MTRYRKQNLSPEEFLNEYGDVWLEVNLYNAEIEGIEKNAVGEYYTATVSLHRSSRVEFWESLNEFKVGQVYDFDGQRTVITQAQDEEGWIQFSPPIGIAESAWVNSDLAKNMKLVLDVEE
jgi:hypothetical protein